MPKIFIRPVLPGEAWIPAERFGFIAWVEGAAAGHVRLRADDAAACAAREGGLTDYTVHDGRPKPSREEARIRVRRVEARRAYVLRAVSRHWELMRQPTPAFILDELDDLACRWIDARAEYHANFKIPSL